MSLCPLLERAKLSAKEASSWTKPSLLGRAARFCARKAEGSERRGGGKITHVFRQILLLLCLETCFEGQVNLFVQAFEWILFALGLLSCTNGPRLEPTLREADNSAGSLALLVQSCGRSLRMMEACASASASARASASAKAGA